MGRLDRESVPLSPACVDNFSPGPFVRQSLHLARIRFATARRREGCVGLEFGEPPDRVVDADRGPVHPLLYESRIRFFNWRGVHRDGLR